MVLERLTQNPRNSLSIDVFARAGSSAFTSIFIVRHLGPAKSGALVFATAVAAIGLPLAAAGTNEVLFQRFADRLKPSVNNIQSPFEAGNSEEGLGDGWITSAWEIRVRSTALSILLCIAVGTFATRDVVTIGLCALSLLAVPFDIATVRLIAHRNLGLAIYSRLRTLFVFETLKLAAVFAQLPVQAFAALGTLETLGLAHASYRSQKGPFSRTRSSNPFALQSGHNLKRYSLKRSSFPFLIATMLNMALLRIDVLIVKARLGTVEVGRYAAVVRIVELSLLPFAVLVPMALTTFRMQTTPGSADFRRKSNLMFFRVATMAAAMSFALAIIAPQLIEILYGPQFSVGTSAALRILAVALPFAVCVTLRDSYFALIKRQNLVVWGPLLGLFVNIGLNLFLLQSIGIAGASIASVAGYAIALLVPFALLSLSRKTSKVEPKTSRKSEGNP